jgi:hypothetical protein
MKKSMISLVIFVLITIGVLAQMDGFEWLPGNYRVIAGPKDNGFGILWATIALEERIGVGDGVWVTETYWMVSSEKEKFPMGTKNDLQIRLHLKRIETLLREILSALVPTALFK